MSSRLCKYHGRSCQYPGDCLNRAPRKYEGDGHMEVIDPERLILGNVVRMNGKGLSTFSDNVVIGIYVSYSRHRTSQERCDKWHFKALDEAIKHAQQGDYVMVKLARPYLYASNALVSVPNWLVGVEPYEVFGDRLMDTHKVVVMSTGEYACHMSREPLCKWVVKVDGAIVFDDLSEDGAKATYKIHRAMAQGAYGRKVGRTVTLLCDDVVDDEYKGDVLS